MLVSEIQSPVSLREWLQDQSFETSVAIANRAACRVFPFFVAQMTSVWKGDGDLTEFDLLIRLFVSGVVRTFPSETSKAAKPFLIFVDFFGEVDRSSGATGATGTAGAAASAAILASQAALAFGDASPSYVWAAKSVGCAAEAAGGVLWDEVRSDVDLILQNQDIFRVPLWSFSQPSWYSRDMEKVRGIWSKYPPGTWDFWLRWWDGVLSGKPLNWELQRDIVLELTAEDWEAGPARVAERIAEIEVRYAIARTPNAEIIGVNPSTGFVRADPVSRLRSDHLNDILDTLSDASKLFDGHGGPNGPYGTFENECTIIDDAVVRYGKRPIMLLRICRRIVERVKIKEANGDCPKEDPLAADFVSSVASAAGDLMAFDQDVREAETARAAINLTPPSAAIAKALALAADQASEISEGDLKAELPTDARLAASSPSTSEGQIAMYQTKSRLLRLLEVTKSNGKHAVDHVEKYPVVYSAILAVLLFLLA